MSQKDDQPDHIRARDLIREAEERQREIEREEAEERAFAELANSPEGRCIMHPRR